jgi:hypothetical protein
MAALDAGSRTVETSSIRHYGELLDALDGKCREDRTEIADVVAKGVRFLAENDGRPTHLEFLQSMNNSMPNGSLDLQCAEIVAMLVAAMERR